MEKLVYYLKQIMMNPQKVFKLLFVFLLAAVVMTACKKDEPVDVPPDSSPIQQLSQDGNSVEENVDEATIDAGQVLSGTFKSGNMGIPCGATLDSTVMMNDTIIYFLTYDGLNCHQTRYRKGAVHIKIKQNTHWLFPGAFITIHFHNYEVTNVFTNNKMVINGMSRLENVSGGIPALLGNGFSTVIHKNTAHVHISFNGNQAREWHLTRMLVYSGLPGNLMLAVNGFGFSQGYNNLLSWGTDRHGKKFFTQIGESVVFRESCQWLPSSGEEIFTIQATNLKATATFGYNSNNEPISGTECPTRYRLDWQQHGQSGTIFLPLQ
jgi:hypothetical protein